jgi:tellurite resistance protein TehA-like permease
MKTFNRILFSLYIIVIILHIINYVVRKQDLTTSILGITTMILLALSLIISEKRRNKN